MVHYMQRERMKTLGLVKKWLEAESDQEKVIKRAMKEIGCTQARAEIYVKEALYG